MTEYTTKEMMIRTAANELLDDEMVFVGIGTPMLAGNLAKLSHAPGLTLVYESGIIGSPAASSGVPTSIADPRLVSGAVSVLPMFEGFSTYLQGGKIDVGFLGGAQIDKWGNINSTVIGDYEDPTVRLPGSGGACDIASNAERIIIITPHEPRRFPEEVDFITSPGFVGGRDGREDLGLQGGGPSAVITDKAVMRFSEEGQMYVESLHPGVTREEVSEATGWDIHFDDDLGTTAEPTDEEIHIIRNELDPERIYLTIPDE